MPESSWQLVTKLHSFTLPDTQRRPVPSLWDCHVFKPQPLGDSHTVWNQTCGNTVVTAGSTLIQTACVGKRNGTRYRWVGYHRILFCPKILMLCTFFSEQNVDTWRANAACKLKTCCFVQVHLIIHTRVDKFVSFMMFRGRITVACNCSGVMLTPATCAVGSNRCVYLLCLFRHHFARKA